MGRAVKKKKSSTRKKSARKAKPARRSTPKKPEADQHYGNEFAALVLFALALFVAVALWSYFRNNSLATELSQNTMGTVGAVVAHLLASFLGYCSFSLVLVLLLASRTAWQMEKQAALEACNSVVKYTVVFVSLLLSLSTLTALFYGELGGGRIGALAAEHLQNYFNTAGAVLLCVLTIVLTLVAVTELSFALILKAIIGAQKACVSAARFVVDSALWTLSGIRSLLGSLWGEIVAQWEARGEEAYDDEEESEQASKKHRGSTFVLGTESKGRKREVELEENCAEFDEGLDEGFDELELPEQREVKIQRRDYSMGEKARTKPVAAQRKQQLADYQNPSLDLLVGSDEGSSLGPEDEQLIENSHLLEEALKNFRIGGRVVEVHPGPVITLYQFAPAPGVKVQRVINLADDLALALKVASVRVYAPVPGKGTVGIEVPNHQREIVRLRDVLESDNYSVTENPLPLALGKDTYGEPYVAHLPRMPHLLIAGATGTGKSVCINSLLLSLLCKNSPEELNLILIDPKMLELSIYEDIPHLKAPVVTNAKRARGVLWWAVEEMERRYRLLKDVGVRDVAAYNKLCAAPASGNGKPKRRRKNVTIELQERDVVATGSPNEGLDRSSESIDQDDFDSISDMERLPRIVVVVDELADLMLSVGREIEDLLARLAQKARAAGIHLILATQRPSVNVITGLIKANFPARISFKVASKIDARTVLDTSGSEKLLGQGDLLFLAPWVGQMKRLHSPYVSDQEVHDICDWLRRQGAPMYDASIENMISKLEESEGSSSGGLTMDGEDYDEFYDRAVSLVIEKGQASTSMVQRAFRIGYNRAARILDTMEREGVVGPADGARPRPILVGSVDGANQGEI